MHGEWGRYAALHYSQVMALSLCKNFPLDSLAGNENAMILMFSMDQTLRTGLYLSVFPLSGEGGDIQSWES